MDGVRYIGGWTVDFRSNQAYIRLSIGNVAIRSDTDSRLGLVDVYKIPDHIRPLVKYPDSFELLETLPFVEKFGTQKLMIR